MKIFERFRSKSETTPDQPNKTQEDLAAIKEKRERVTKLADQLVLDQAKQIEFPEGVLKPENSTGHIEISKGMVDVMRNNVDSGQVSTEKILELAIAFPTKKLEQTSTGEVSTVESDNVVYRIRENKIYDCREGDYKTGVPVDDIDSPQFSEVETILSAAQQ